MAGQILKIKLQTQEQGVIWRSTVSSQDIKGGFSFYNDHNQEGSY